MDILVSINSFEDLKQAVKVIGDYGCDCVQWTVKGTIWTKEED
jgi:hypothetical protein